MPDVRRRKFIADLEEYIRLNEEVDKVFASGDEGADKDLVKLLENLKLSFDNLTSRLPSLTDAKSTQRMVDFLTAVMPFEAFRGIDAKIRRDTWHKIAFDNEVRTFLEGAVLTTVVEVAFVMQRNVDMTIADAIQKVEGELGTVRQVFPESQRQERMFFGQDSFWIVDTTKKVEPVPAGVCVTTYGANLTTMQQAIQDVRGRL